MEAIVPDGINNVDSTVLKLAEQYQSCNVRSRELNDERKVIRENVDKLGIDPSAFTVALAMVRDKTPGERQDYQNSLNRVLGALDGKEVDLFGQADIDARNKRADKRAERDQKKGTSREQQDDKSDKNKRSNPDAGGAGKRGRGKGKAADTQAAGDGGEGTGDDDDQDGPVMVTDPVTGQTRPETGDELIKRVAAQKNAELEQREGGNVLNGVGTQPVDNVVDISGKKSQSQQAAEKRAAAKLN